MKGDLLNIIVGSLFKRRSIPFMVVLLGAIYLCVITMFDGWKTIVVGSFWYWFIGVLLCAAGLGYTVACFVIDRLPRAPKGTLGVLFCIDAESASLYEAAEFKLAESFNDANPGGAVRVIARCISKKQIKGYDIQNKDIAVKLLQKTNCVLLVRVRYSADNANNAENFELKIGCGVRHPYFDEKANAVIVKDMSMLTEKVRNQHFTNKNAILIVEIIKKVNVVRIFVQINGIVIWKNCSILPAPSSPALSYRLSGTLAIDAIYMTI